MGLFKKEWVGAGKPGPNPKCRTGDKAVNLERAHNKRMRKQAQRLGLSCQQAMVPRAAVRYIFQQSCNA